MKKFVQIIMGSKSDLTTLEETFNILKKFEIEYQVLIASAHRTPEIVKKQVQKSQDDGAQVFICAAGLAAHLAGAVAANTIKPVIGIPISAGSLQGMDALLSTVMMPGGVPVATVAIGKAGAQNAAHLAAQIMALADEQIADKIINYRLEKQKEILAQNQDL